jgi:hypothetical protein
VDKTKQNFHDHFHEELCSEIKEYAENDVFKSSRYIFVRKKGKQRYGYCTHCKQEYQVDILKHNSGSVCPACKSSCTVKSSGLGRSKMIDEAYFVYYEKSRINPLAVIARGIYAVRDYSGDYRTTETKYVVRAWYIFEPGKSLMFERYGFYSWAHTMTTGTIRKRDTVFSLRSQYSANSRCVNITHCRESVEAAVKGTPFRYSTWESYAPRYACEDDMVKFFSLYARYPCIEYLTKLGFEDLVITKLEGHHAYGAVNWRGKSILDVLRLTRQDIKLLKEKEVMLSPLILRLLQITKADKSQMSLPELFTFADKYDCYFTDLQKVLKYASLKKADAYITKQFTQKNIDPDNRKHWYQEHSVLHDWKDYLEDCRRLELDLTQECVIFPSHLYRAHQNTIAQVKVQGDVMLDKKIKNRLSMLKKYSFDFAGLLLRPIAGTAELIAEGKALNHCVGTYAKSYANGKTNIFAVRKASEPNTPFYTMEIRDNKIVQCRGKKNCSPNDEVQWFIEEFEIKKLGKKNVEARISVSA